MTREEWLNELAGKLRPMFEEHGATLPALLHISCGWPTHRALTSSSSKSRTIGQCFAPECSAGGFTEVFISPCIADSVAAGAVLVHELVHAAGNAGHGAKFRKLAVVLGLEGKMTATTAGAELAKRLNALCESIGPYPHATLDLSKEKKQGTRMIKVVCPECGYTVRTTRQWIVQGLPTCVCGTEMELPEEGEE
jgi:hypothetical protein